VWHPRLRVIQVQLQEKSKKKNKCMTIQQSNFCVHPSKDGGKLQSWKTTRSYNTPSAHFRVITEVMRVTFAAAVIE
jgi:hypothetical protein